MRLKCHECNRCPKEVHDNSHKHASTLYVYLLPIPECFGLAVFTPCDNINNKFSNSGLSQFNNFDDALTDLSSRHYLELEQTLAILKWKTNLTYVQPVNHTH